MIAINYNILKGLGLKRYSFNTFEMELEDDTIASTSKKWASLAVTAKS